MSKVRIVTGKATARMVKDDNNYKLKQVSTPKGELKRKQCNGMGAGVKGGSYLGV